MIGSSSVGMSGLGVVCVMGLVCVVQGSCV